MRRPTRNPLDKLEILEIIGGASSNFLVGLYPITSVVVGEKKNWEGQGAM